MLLTPLRVLYVEDQPTDVQLLARELERSGFAPSGERVDTREGFLTQLDPALDVIFSDFTMPSFNGLEALRLMKERHFDVPFIFVSGTIGEETAVTAMHEGAADYLIKDRLARLGSAVTQALAQRRLKREKLAAERTAARLAAIIETSGEAIIAMTLDGCVTSWNPAAEGLYGYSAQEMFGAHVSVLFPQDRRQTDTPENMEEIKERLQKGENIVAFETVRVRKDRRRVEVLQKISPIRDASGSVIGASAIAHDITQRKRSERFLNVEQAVTGILTDCRDLQEAGPRILQTIAECLRWEVALFWTVDREANVLRRLHCWHSSWAKASFVEALERHTILEPGEGVAGRTWSTSEPVWEPGIVIDSQVALTMTREGLRGGFGFPMRQGADMLGVIEFYNPEIHEPDKLLLAALDNVASQISLFCEQRRSEVALRASEERYRVLANCLPGGVYTSTDVGECDFCNRWWCDYTGSTAEQLLRTGWADALHPDDRKQTLDALAESMRTGHPFQREHRFCGADGLYRWFLDRSVPLRDEGGQVIRWFGTRVDIDDRKCAEAERDRILQRLQLQIERIPLAYILFDADCRIVDWNPTAERILGYTREEMLGTGPPYAKYVPRSFWEKGEEIRSRIRSGDMQAHSINTNLTKEGREITCEWFNTPLMDEHGKFEGYLCLAQDITEQRSLEEQYRQAQKMEAIGRLAGGVAHDFNNLLTIIVGYGDIMLRSFKADDRNFGPMQEIVAAGERATALTRQLLLFSRQQVLCPQVLNLNTVLADSEKMLRRLIGEDIELKVIKAPSLDNVKADPGQVEQVLLNLAVNARDAMPRGGQLILSTHNVRLTAEELLGYPDNQPGPHVLLTVSDNGSGMDRAIQSRIFEPFFTTKGTKGTGLGLATVFGIVKQLQGKIEVHSEPDRGTTFKIYLPRVTEPLSPSSIREVPACECPRGSETILLAEDEEGVRTLARQILQANGFTVLEAADGAQAIHIFEEQGNEIDLLITDVVMPRMSGRELADQLVQKRPDIKVLYLSGYTDDAVVLHGVFHDQTHFLQKPFNPAGFALKVREVLNARSELSCPAGPGR
jgi:PAS domain S-box-containing protein